MTLVLACVTMLILVGLFVAIAWIAWALSRLC